MIAVVTIKSYQFYQLWSFPLSWLCFMSLWGCSFQLLCHSHCVFDAFFVSKSRHAEGHHCTEASGWGSSQTPETRKICVAVTYYMTSILWTLRKLRKAYFLMILRYSGWHKLRNPRMQSRRNPELQTVFEIPHGCSQTPLTSFGSQTTIPFALPGLWSVNGGHSWKASGRLSWGFRT